LKTNVSHPNSSMLTQKKERPWFPIHCQLRHPSPMPMHSPVAFQPMAFLKDSKESWQHVSHPYLESAPRQRQLHLQAVQLVFLHLVGSSVDIRDKQVWGQLWQVPVRGEGVWRVRWALFRVCWKATGRKNPTQLRRLQVGWPVLLLIARQQVAVLQMDAEVFCKHRLIVFLKIFPLLSVHRAVIFTPCNWWSGSATTYVRT